MCNGTIMDKLISFAFPLMLSGILQLMFNAVDIIVVGRFSGSQALAAVGSTTALINVFVNLFIGISLGANVLAARFYAAGREEEMSQTVHTAITLALISGVVMAFVGVLFAKGALELMGTPDDVISQSTLYMRIYFMGMPFFMLYNYGAAILRAIGDTKRPLIFLIISGIHCCHPDDVPVVAFNTHIVPQQALSAKSRFFIAADCLPVLRQSPQIHSVQLFFLEAVPEHQLCRCRTDTSASGIGLSDENTVFRLVMMSVNIPDIDGSQWLVVCQITDDHLHHISGLHMGPDGTLW